MNNYNLLPDSICFRFGGMQHDMRPAVFGGAGNMSLLYTNFEKTVVLATQIKTFEELDLTIKEFLEKNKWNLKGQYFYIPNSVFGEEKVIHHK